MALRPASVVDVIALVAAPVLGSRDVVLAGGGDGLEAGEGVGLGVVAAFAAVAEVKVQKGALGAVPLAVLAVVVFAFAGVATSAVS